MQEENAPSDQLKQGVMRFDAIRNGGQFRIVYVPGSAMDDGPEARLQKYATLRQMGVFGDPADPDTNKLFIELVNMPEASKILNHLEEQQNKIKQAQVQQQEMMQAQMEMQAQSQQQQQPSFDIEAEQAKAEIEIAKKRAEIQAKLEADITLLTAKAGLESQDEPDDMESGLGSTGGMMGMGEPQLRPPMPEMEEELPEEDMFNPDAARQAIMQRQQGGGMPMEEAMPMEDVGTMQENEGIL
jgi:NACalpha-BTF3-like transcription factor